MLSFSIPFGSSDTDLLLARCQGALVSERGRHGQTVQVSVFHGMVFQWNWSYADGPSVTDMTVTVGSDSSCNGYDDSPADPTEQPQSIPCAASRSD